MSTDKLDTLIERIVSEHGIVLSQDDSHIKRGI